MPAGGGIHPISSHILHASRRLYAARPTLTWRLYGGRDYAEPKTIIKDGVVMTFDLMLGLMLAFGLLAYLIAALLAPERF
jgi:K+-transporting ATPase KdpF subunit